MDDDGLAEFEKSLAADRAQREREERGRERKRKDRDADGGKRRREHSREGGRHKRSRHSNADEEHKSREHRHREHKERRSHGDREHRSSRHRSSRDDASDSRPSRDAQTPADKDTEMKMPQRDSWMTAPSALDIDYVHRRNKERTPPPKKSPSVSSTSGSLTSN